MLETMDIAQAARIMREATKDKSYQLFPMGQEAAAYLRMKRKRLTDSSYRDYERGLDKLARHFPDLELADFEPPVGTERIEEFLDAQYGGSSPRNYNKNLSILRDFFKFQVMRQRLHGDPTLAVERAKARQPYRTTFSSEQIRAIYASADLRARLAAHLVLDYGLRKESLRGIKFEHFSFERKRVTIFAKGGKVRTMPIPDLGFWRELEQLKLEIGAQQHHYLISRRRLVPVGSPDAWGHRERRWYYWPEEPMATTSLHRYWYDEILAPAGIVEKGTYAGQKMHKGRHTAGQRMLDATGNIKAVQKHLGHSSIQTTADVYTDWDEAQLAASLEIMLDETP